MRKQHLHQTKKFLTLMMLNPDDVEPVEEESGNLTNGLARWVFKYQISRNVSNDLLTILRQYGHPEMPKCTRTLLKNAKRSPHRDQMW